MGTTMANIRATTSAHFFIWSNLREVENQKQSIYFVYLNFILIMTFSKNHKLFLLFTLLDILLYFQMKEFSKTICAIIFALLTLKTPSIMLQFYVSWYMLRLARLQIKYKSTENEHISGGKERVKLSKAKVICIQGSFFFFFYYIFF